METSSPLDRRAALKLGLGTSIGGLIGLASARAEDRSGNQQPSGTNVKMAPRTDPPPLVDARFPCEIAEDVWVIPDRRVFLVPNIGIVVGKEAALVIDSGLGPVCGQAVVRAAEGVAPGRRLILTQTHAHPEHAFGAAAFKNRAEIFLNRQQDDYLARIGPTMLQLFRDRYGEQVKQILEGAEIVRGTDFYDGDRASLDLGGRQVDFQAIGTAHSPGDQTIFLPKERILFAGDLIEERMFPIVPVYPPTIVKSDIDVTRWAETLSSLEQTDPSIIVPGHGNLGQAEIARSVREYFADVQARVRKMAEGEDIEALVSKLKPEVLATYPTWEHDRFIEPAIRYFAS
jgi:glyoxylase-like metal-dependent hydrolase (beta-lactamase superfamily II)